MWTYKYNEYKEWLWFFIDKHGGVVGEQFENIKKQRRR